MGDSRISDLWNIGQQLVRDGRGWILLLVAVGWALSVGTRYIFPVTFPYFQEDFGFSLSTLGALYTLLWVAYALGQFPGGGLADRIGERAVLVLSTVISGGTLVVVSLAFGLWTLAIGMVLFGLSSAMYGTTRFTIITDIYSRYDGTAIGLIQSAGMIGNSLLPVIAGVLAAYFAWQFGFLYILPLFLATGIGLWITVPPRTSGSANAVEELSIDTVRYVLYRVSTSQTVALTAILALVMFVVQAVTSFYPTYLVDVKGLTPGAAATIFGFVFVCAMVVQPLAAALGDVFDQRRTQLAATVSGTLALILVPLASGIVQLVLVTALFSCVYGVIPITLTRLTNILPDDMKGTGLGLLRTTYFLFAATGSMVVGAFADWGLFDESFFVLAAVATVSLGLILVLPRSRE